MPPANPPAGATPGVLSLVLGVASIPLVFCFVLGLPAGIAAIALGVTALREPDPPESGRWQPVTGIVCGVVALAAIVTVILLPN